MPHVRSMAVVEADFSRVDQLLSGEMDFAGAFELFPALLHLRVASLMLIFKIAAARTSQPLLLFTVLHAYGVGEVCGSDATASPRVRCV